MTPFLAALFVATSLAAAALCCLYLVVRVTLALIDGARRHCRHHDHLLPATPRSPRG